MVGSWQRNRAFSLFRMHSVSSVDMCIVHARLIGIIKSIECNELNATAASGITYIYACNTAHSEHCEHSQWTMTHNKWVVWTDVESFSFLLIEFYQQKLVSKMEIYEHKFRANTKQNDRKIASLDVCDVENRIGK